jgi:integrase
VKTNPFREVSYPSLPKKLPSIPSEESVQTFFAWLQTRYPGWTLIRLYCEVKALSGCRTWDLCSVKSGQLRGGNLFSTAETDKTNRERLIPLPQDLAQALDRIKGPTYLWERYTQDARTYRPGPGNRQTFAPEHLYHAITKIFGEFGQAHPEHRFSPHALRRRAITLTAAATQSVDLTAQAMHIDPQTARKYYLDSQRAFDGQEVLRPSGALEGAPEKPRKEGPQDVKVTW